MGESETIHLSHNVSVLIYHFVCPAKYRRVVFEEDVDEELKNVCVEIEKRYDIRFLEIGTDKNHVHFLVQSTPKMSPTEIITMIKSITAREIFKRCPEVKKKLWGGQFWTDGFYVSTVGQHGNEEVIRKYVQNQGTEKEYKSLLVQQLSMFE
ncbi:IS200/IS605 family transposase [Faecalispora anaeroviscerum]|uniref:IS200/IS605 family transposase n=1 Tax=Faecalispora anaeroviscerum TaxID=2991836 RepID=UPI0024B98104|nr:IS200/IS605 family transposase [Faecalispora anaeroviscerum]